MYLYTHVVHKVSKDQEPVLTALVSTHWRFVGEAEVKPVNGSALIEGH